MGEWGRLTVRLRGRRLEAWLNGRQVHDLSLDTLSGAVPGTRARLGRVGLLAWRGRVEVRNVSLRELFGP